MFVREMKTNFKNFIIWTLILVGIFIAVYLIYPTIIKAENFNEIDKMIQMFPENILKAFNMDIISINTAFGWVKTEGWTFALLIIGTYSSMLGGNILLKEESDKTIEYLGCLPVSRTKIVICKVTCAFIYILSMVGIFAIVNYISLTLSGDFNQKEFFLLSLTPLISAVPLFTISLFISTFFRKTKKMIGISIGITFLSYVLNILSEISSSVENLKYLSVFTLSDVRNVITNMEINISMVIIGIIISLVFIASTIIRFNRREFI